MKLTKTDGREIKISSRKREVATLKVLRNRVGLEIAFRSIPLTKALIKEAGGRYSPKTAFDQNGEQVGVSTYNLGNFINDCATSSERELQYLGDSFNFDMRSLGYSWNFVNKTCTPNLSFMAITHKPQDFVNTTIVGTFTDRQIETFTDTANEYIQKLWEKLCYVRSIESVISVATVMKKEHD